MSKADGTASIPERTFVAFAGTTRIAAGALADVAAAARRVLELDGATRLCVFDQFSGAVVDLDLRGDEATVRARYASQPRPVDDLRVEASPEVRRGRPKLGVVAREVTLLPRHWDWLAQQPGGASVALRKLVEGARKRDQEAGQARARGEAAYRFMAALAGDLPGFEDAARALFAQDEAGLQQQVRDWPADVCDQLFAYLQAAAPS